MNRARILSLCECAVLLALSVVLSLIIIYKLPMGGEVTLISMLPVLVAGIKHGVRRGLGVAFTFSLIQLFMGIVGGGVFPRCTTWQAVAVCVIFDYLVPFTILGLGGIMKIRDGTEERLRISGVISALLAIRFICHFITGLVIWGQWAPEGMGKVAYSLIYNSQYMIPELLLTLIAANVILSVPQMKRFLVRQ